MEVHRKNDEKKKASQNRSRIYKYTNTFILDTLSKNVQALHCGDIPRENNLYWYIFDSTKHRIWKPRLGENTHKNGRKVGFLANFFIKKSDVL